MINRRKTLATTVQFSLRLFLTKYASVSLSNQHVFTVDIHSRQTSPPKPYQ